MKCRIKKAEYGHDIKIIPENKKDIKFIKEWDFYIEKFIDKKGNIRLLI